MPFKSTGRGKSFSMFSDFSAQTRSSQLVSQRYLWLLARRSIETMHSTLPTCWKDLSARACQSCFVCPTLPQPWQTPYFCLHSEHFCSVEAMLINSGCHTCQLTFFLCFFNVTDWQVGEDVSRECFESLSFSKSLGGILRKQAYVLFAVGAGSRKYDLNVKKRGG